MDKLKLKLWGLEIKAEGMKNLIKKFKDELKSYERQISKTKEKIKSGKV